MKILNYRIPTEISYEHPGRYNRAVLLNLLKYKVQMFSEKPSMSSSVSGFFNEFFITKLNRKMWLLLLFCITIESFLKLLFTTT